MSTPGESLSALTRRLARPRVELPLVRVPLTRCPACGTADVSAYRSTSYPDGTRLRYTACRAPGCGCRFRVLAE